jgi:uncharacterized protein
MPVQVSYPGIYINEVQSSNPVVIGVSTSNTAFVDFFPCGPVGPSNAPVAYQINSWSQFQSVYGGLDTRSEASYGIMQYFTNGGQIAWVVRVLSPDAAAATWATATSVQGTSLVFSAASPGVWGNNVQVTITSPIPPVGNLTPTVDRFNLTVQEVVNGSVVDTETYLNLTLNPADPNNALAVVNAESSLVQLSFPTQPAAAPIPTVTGTQASGAQPVYQLLTNGQDGSMPDFTNLTTVNTALGALDRIAPSVFNILCMPALANISAGAMTSILPQVTNFCLDRQAFMIVDIPSSVANVQQVSQWAQQFISMDAYASAVYFPRLIIPDPINNYLPRNVGASGTLAGVYARTDTADGVWTAPAGINATLQGANLAVQVTDAQDGQLNPLGINCLRTFPVYGNVCWGTRTMAGADLLQSEWKYIPVRRLVDYIEQSLVQSLKWVVFQPNDQQLWTQITVEVGNFLSGLYSQGAFQGATPSQAYFVNCNSTTTTPTDIAQGIVNIVIGVAPVDPAEFVILQIQQIAGQTGQ